MWFLSFFHILQYILKFGKPLGLQYSFQSHIVAFCTRAYCLAVQDAQGKGSTPELRPYHTRGDCECKVMLFFKLRYFFMRGFNKLTPYFRICLFNPTTISRAFWYICATGKTDEPKSIPAQSAARKAAGRRSAQPTRTGTTAPSPDK